MSTTVSAPPRDHQMPLTSGAGGTIRGRVARILALPAVVVLLLLSLLAAEQVQQQRSSQDTSRSVTLALAVQELVHELQTERGITAAVLSGNPSFTDELAPSRRLVDRQRAAVQGLVRTGSGAQAQIRSALQDLGDIATLRTAVDTPGKADRAKTFGYFTARIAALTSVDTGLDNGSDTRLRQGVATLQALADLTEATSQERAFLTGVFSAGGFREGEFVQFAAMRADRLSAAARFARFATTEQQAAYDFVFGTGAAQVTNAFEQVAIAAADGRHIVVNPQSWWSGLTTVLDDLNQLQQHVGSQIQIRAHDLQQGSLRRIAALIAVVVLCFAGSIYLTVLASRSITRPLAALADEADAVATHRLPEAVHRLQSDDASPPSSPKPVQVPARATSEIRSVANALDRMQGAAYGLATDQAIQRRDTIESMANLGRRNQNLIRRQLGFITSLEREEIDPNSLANLFELDHLATRMRRNAASLLVLVGASSPRQWTSAVSVADMIRAALSEVEEYRRVTLRRVDEAFVTGVAVGSVAHLLAELIENGLTFSPPDMDVEIQGRRLADGYLIAITDQGVGMSTSDLRQANSRLKGEGDFIAAPTRFLGHFVVGKLARETGVDVELLPSPVAGVTARITVPSSLMTKTASVTAHPINDTGSRPRHSVGTNGSGAAAQLGAQRLALPQNSPPQTPSVWKMPGSGQPVTASGRAQEHDADMDRTPSSGIPVPGRSAFRRTGQHTGEQPQWPSARPGTFTPVNGTRKPARTGPIVTAAAANGSPFDDLDPTAAEGQSDRTQNGLRKRAPRASRAPGAVTGPVPRTGPISPRSPAVDGSPTEVRARMTALRAGIQRGQAAQTGQTGQTGQITQTSHAGQTGHTSQVSQVSQVTEAGQADRTPADGLTAQGAQVGNGAPSADSDSDSAAPSAAKGSE